MFYLYTLLVMTHSPADYNKMVCIHPIPAPITRFNRTYLRDRCFQNEIPLGYLSEVMEIRDERTYGLSDRRPKFANDYIDEINQILAE